MTADTTWSAGPQGASRRGGTAELTERWRAVMMDNYGTPAMALVRGEGSAVWDADGMAYLDFTGGIAVNALGHAHPAIVRAVSEQVARLAHVSNLFVAEPPVALAERLLRLANRDGRVFFANSGAEANEAAFKIARRTGRPQLVAAEGGFHGRTMGALALTGQPGKREPFLPLPGEVTYVPFGDTEALRAAVTDRTAAVIVEPVQGEAGVVPAPPGYLRAARDITRASGSLLMLDEVQTGIGRTGHWFAHQAHPGVDPDVVTLAKGLGGGLPIGAALAFGPAADLLAPGQHGSTFGGNPVACAAALAVLDTIENDGLLAHTEAMGARLRRGIEAVGHPLVRRVRGAGLLLAIVFDEPVAPRVQESAREAGFLVNAVNPTTVRLAPALTVSADEVNALVAALPTIFG
ncbi:acetylornithine transaminase [Streptomyces albipurpureus]|uniref:Acetylornithine aminotransferase n=1 Tax=Streptomyces albipurpureus TaxID=2897419 RepID=A0ABT0UVZ9_9ACTN|nr:acetylornithine transaminase [Streptomyces sp. CWNU-1]MCM2392758.1 acetylornithine transaminase [Streptomyces sp. CWNU-1]